MIRKQPHAVEAHHLQRNALLCVWQAAMARGAESSDGLEHQYALRERVVALGWPVTNIIVLDDDLGRPATPRNREGFERVIREVRTGHVGIVLAADVSRLARDWQRLLDACSQADILIATDDDVYDPKDVQS